MIIALGKGDTDEYRDNLHKVGKIFYICIKLRFIFLMKMIGYRSASNYEEKWGFFSQIKQKMKYKSKYPLRTSLALQ